MAQRQEVQVLCLGVQARDLVKGLAPLVPLRVQPAVFDPEVAPPTGSAPDVIVVGADAKDPLRLAQEARKYAPWAQVLFLAPPDRLERLTTALPFVPHMASAWTLESDAAPEALAEVISRAGNAARQRSDHALIAARINEQLSRVAPGDAGDRRMRQLALSERYLAALLSQAPDALVSVGAGGRVQAWNNAAEDLFGITSGAAIGQSVAEVLPPDLAALILPQLNPGGAPQALVRHELSFQTRAHALRWVECSVAPVLSASGDVAALSIHLVDITDRHEAEARLRDSEARYRTLAETLPQLVWTCLPDGSCNYLSPQWIAYTGLSAEEQLGLAWLDRVIHPDDRQRTYEHWMGAVEGLHGYDIEYRIRDRHGVFRWFKTRGTPVRNADGAIAYWFGTCTDIQDIVEARETLARSAEDLEARVQAEVAERSKAEDALRQAQKMEAVGQLTGGIAHDFNNLLQGIVGSLDLIRRRLDQGRFDDLDRLLDGATTSANRAAALTHRLLAFSRRQPLSPEVLEANPLISSMEDLLQRTLGEQVRLTLALASDLWMTLCDPNQLETALLNLAINARDAMPSGGRLVIETANVRLDDAYCRGEPDLSPGDYICIAVSDTGVGMTPDVIAKAFEPFFTTKAIGQGTGLGLSMIYGFARQSHGHVRLYSEPGCGTAAKLYLPRHQGSRPQQEPAKTRTPTPGARAGETVLVVEDEAVVRGLVLEVLSELGYAALEAADGPEGLRVVQSSARIDLLVTDIGLPGLNGRRLAEAARLARPGLKVLFMTGYAENAVHAEGMLEPGMAMITKPFAVEALASRIRSMIEPG